MNNNHKGYTMVELALIVFVLSVAMAIAAPSVRKAMNDYRLDCFDRMIASDVRYAQRQASINWLDCEVKFDNSARKIRICMGAKIIKSDAYPSHVDLYGTNFTNKEIHFNEFGNPSSGGSLHVSCGGLKHTITILPVTGRVKIYEFEKY